MGAPIRRISEGSAWQPRAITRRRVGTGIAEAQGVKPVKLALVALPLLLSARPADACSPLQCWPGAFVPNQGATVPASAEALYWRPMSGQVEIDPASVRLVASGEPVAITTTELPNGDYLIEPTQPLVSGTEYRLEDSTECGESGTADGPQATFTATAAVALPTVLGSLVATAPARSTITVGTSSGSCSSEADVVSANVSLTFDAGAAPWRHVLHYTTYVDDQVWASSGNILASTDPGASWIGRGADRLYSVCSSEDTGIGDGLSEGSHVVRIEATLPGTSVALVSSTVTVELDCNPPIDGDDGGDTTDDGDDTAGDDGTTDLDDDGGCSTGGGAGLLVALGALTLRRRRRP